MLREKQKVNTANRKQRNRIMSMLKHRIPINHFNSKNKGKNKKKIKNFKFNLKKKEIELENQVKIYHFFLLQNV